MLAQFDGLRPARLKVGVISTGRVGTALGAALERAEHVVVACCATSIESRRRAEKSLPETPILPAPDVAAAAELLLLAVPDPQLPTVISRLAAAAAVRPKTIVAHTSGVNGISLLEPLTRQGCLPLAIHPAMTFTGSPEDLDRIAVSCFGVTAADEVGYTIAESLSLEVGAEPVRISEDKRPLYHAALCHGGNHLVTLVADALSALRAALPGGLGLDDPDGSAERILGPLARAALDNALRFGRGAVTGPVARDDAEALTGHLVALTVADPALAEAYRADALRTAQCTAASRDVLAVLSP